MTRNADLVRELTELRRGRGVWTTKPRGRVGPLLRELAQLPPELTGMGERDIRTHLIEVIRRCAAALPENDQHVIEVAFALHPDTHFRLLGDRVSYLAGELCCAERTVRRRIDRATSLLADEMLAEGQAADQSGDPQSGWRVTEFNALLRLDTPTPELIEERSIVAVRDGLDTITARFSLPRWQEEGHNGPAACLPPHGQELIADIQQGALILQKEREGEAHFRFLLKLPRTLNRNDTHRYTMVFRLPEGQPMRTHYAFVPLVKCDLFRVRVRFDPADPPDVVWKLASLAPRVMVDRLQPGPPLVLDGANEAALEFTDMALGFGYGLAWLPSARRYHHAE